MSRGPGLDGPLEMGGISMTTAFEGVYVNLVALDPGLTDAFVIGLYTAAGGDVIRLRQNNVATDLYVQQGAANVTRWFDHPFASTSVTSSSANSTTPLSIFVSNIVTGGICVLMYARQSGNLRSWKEYHPLHTFTYNAGSVANDPLSTRLGTDAYLAGVTIGAGTGTEVQLRLPSNVTFWDSDAFVSTDRQTVWLPYPIPTQLIDFSVAGSPVGSLKANVTLSSGGTVTLLYYKKP